MQNLSKRVATCILFTIATSSVAHAQFQTQSFVANENYVSVAWSEPVMLQPVEMMPIAFAAKPNPIYEINPQVMTVAEPHIVQQGIEAMSVVSQAATPVATAAPVVHSLPIHMPAATIQTPTCLSGG